MKLLNKAIACAALLLSPAAALAEETDPNAAAGGFGQAAARVKQAGTIAYGPEATTRNLEQIVGGIIQNVLALLGVLFLALAVYGGYRWMMAKGNEQEVEKAKETIKAAVIGVGIILGAYAITDFVINRLIGATTGIPQ